MNIDVNFAPCFAGKVALLFEARSAIVESDTSIEGCQGVHFAQEFVNSSISFKRVLSWSVTLERIVLDLEARALGVTLARERDLHRLARRYTGRHLMTSIGDGGGGWVVVMKNIEPQIMRVLDGLGCATGPAGGVEARNADGPSHPGAAHRQQQRKETYL